MLDSVRVNSYKNVAIIVVDNASRECPKVFLKANYPEVKVIRSEENLGFAGGNNIGIRESNGEYFFFLNNDAVLTNGALEKMLALFDSNPKLGIVSPKICYFKSDISSDEDLIQYAGATMVHPVTARNQTIGEKELDKNQYSVAKETAYAHGCAMLVKKEVLIKVGLMPEDFFLYYEELDWCEQIRKAGYEIYVEPNATVYHKESYSVKKNSALKTYYINRNRILFMRRHRSAKELAGFYFFLAFFTIPKNALMLLLKRDFINFKAFFRAINWHLTEGRKIQKPVSIFR
ncbi:MAG: GT2 family glycosyltransferase [Saprospiraceae bacterium]|jgi:GT2 family glycosyltransferase